MPKIKQKEGNHNNWLQDVLSKAIQFVTEIATIAMKNATPSQKRVIFVCYGIIVAGIIAIGVPPYLAWKEILALVFLVVSLLTVLFLPRRGKPPLPPLFPLPPYKADKLKTMLEETRKEAFKFLRRNNQVLSDNDVRANIFFPVCDASGKQNKNKLKIYSDLYCMMDSPKEREITFKPKQGATGRVFADGQRRVVQRLPSGNGDWEAVYNITDKQATIIHPDLKWIISMPLLGADKKPIGVVNVDGLRCQFPPGVLSKCMRNLTNHMSIMNQLLIFG